MIQVYPFHSTDVQDIYAKLNAFLAELHQIDLPVPLDHIRTNTKYYPDYGHTATTIEVCVDLSDCYLPHEMAKSLRDTHLAIVNGKSESATEETENGVAEAYRLVRENGARFVLDRNSEGYILTDTSDQGTVFWGVSREDVLSCVQRALGIQPSASHADDGFDPFLDGDDLP